MSIENRETISPPPIIDVYTPADIKKLLPYDPHIIDALALLRSGIEEIRDIDGMESTNSEKAKYEIETRLNPVREKVIKIDENGEEREEDADPVSLQEWWGDTEAAGREPFLMVHSNTQDGVVGVLEGRKYVNRYTNEKSIYVNWVAVRRSGTNDDDTYTYRGREKRSPIAKQLYERVEKEARKNDIELLMAGVNERNEPSRLFHESMGYHKEDPVPGKDPKGHATDNGAFIPGYTNEDINSQGEKITSIINVYSKRLPH